MGLYPWKEKEEVEEGNEFKLYIYYIFIIFDTNNYSLIHLHAFEIIIAMIVVKLFDFIFPFFLFWLYR